MGNIIRTEYINILLNWKDKQFIKVLTGIRRSGKSTILSQYKDYLIKNFDIQQEQIIEYDFNNPNNQNVSYLELYNEITSKANGSATYYVFLDEIQEIKA
jgi:predicted AAA+ superfamily ATPase